MLKVLADMKAGAIRFCLGRWLLFCPITWLRFLLQITDQKFWGNGHTFFGKEQMMPIRVHRITGSNTLILPKVESYCYFQGLKPTSLHQASEFLQVWVWKWPSSQMKFLAHRLIECLYHPQVPDHYRTWGGKTETQSSETMFAGHGRTHSSCLYVHKNWARSSLTKLQHGAGREREFSSGMWPLQGYPCSSTWSYTQAQTGSNKWIQSVLVGEEGDRGGRGEDSFRKLGEREITDLS